MKNGLLILLLCLSTSLFAEMAKLEYVNSNEETTFEEMITKLYNQEIQKKDSALRKAILKKLANPYMSEDEYVFIVDGDFSNGGAYSEKVHMGTIVNTGSGKSGAAFYGADYIVPIMVSSPGSGLITTTEGFIKVSAYHSFYDYDTGLDVERIGVVFEALATLQVL